MENSAQSILDSQASMPMVQSGTLQNKGQTITSSAAPTSVPTTPDQLDSQATSANSYAPNVTKLQGLPDTQINFGNQTIQGAPMTQGEIAAQGGYAAKESQETTGTYVAHVVQGTLEAQGTVKTPVTQEIPGKQVTQGIQVIQVIQRTPGSVHGTQDSVQETLMVQKAQELGEAKGAQISQEADGSIESQVIPNPIIEPQTPSNNENWVVASEEHTEPILQAKGNINRPNNTLLDKEETGSVQPHYQQELISDLRFEPPKSKAELETRLRGILGRSIGELALLSGVSLPYNNLASKGFAGLLIELFLGANAHNLTLPDFISLNVELKTLPLKVNLMPEESTFLCSADLRPENFLPFEQSPLYHKMSNMLFVLLLAPRGFPMAERRILGYFFFTPNQEQWQTIKEDYQDFAELICSGQSNLINGSMGSIIQMRPKTANGEHIIQARDSDGHAYYTRPRGFYLRSTFTSQLCRQFLAEQGITENDLTAFRQRLAINTDAYDDQG